MTGFSHRTKRNLAFKASGAVPATLIAGVLALSGCVEKKPRAIPWATAIQVHPVVPTVVDGVAMSDDAPILDTRPAPAPPDLVVRKPGPARPHAPGGTSNEAEDPSRGSPGTGPVLAPQLSPQDLALAQQQTNESLGIADRSLQAAKAHRLNSVQTDIVSKISSFAAEARKAAGEGDWTRARNLAKKAQVLAEELARQF